MWDVVRTGADHQQGVDLAVLNCGRGEKLTTRIRIWSDVLDQLEFTADDDVTVAVGRAEDAGKIRIRLDRMGEHSLKAPRGTTKYLQLSLRLPELDASRSCAPVEYEVVEEGGALIISYLSAKA